MEKVDLGDEDQFEVYYYDDEDEDNNDDRRNYVM